ncbi:MAG: hypothetical protein IPH93_04010 [Saprospiraceae bacterium]|nr:hypothetical protein [Saprospiraceae bacterium]
MRLILIFIFLTSQILSAQTVDTSLVQNDSTVIKPKKSQSTLKNIFQGKPGIALTYSLLLPGLGQIYNQKYWKLPLVYGALALPVYSIVINQKEYKRYQTAYIMRVDFDTASMDEFVGIYSLNSLKSFRDLYDKNLQRSYLGLVAVYLLVGIDAFVDRHLKEFDVSDDLSLRFNPSFQTLSAGVSIQRKTKSNRSEKNSLF